jgi:hypothetical protein
MNEGCNRLPISASLGAIFDRDLSVPAALWQATQFSSSISTVPFNSALNPSADEPGTTGCALAVSENDNHRAAEVSREKCWGIVFIGKEARG